MLWNRYITIYNIKDKIIKRDMVKKLHYRLFWFDVKL